MRSLLSVIWSKLLADSTIYLIANLTYAISLLASSIYLTMNISLSEFGRQSFIYSIITLLSQVTLFGQGGYNLIFGKSINQRGALLETFIIISLIFVISSIIFYIYQTAFLNTSSVEDLIITLTLFTNSVSLGIYPYIISLKKNKLLIFLKLFQSISLLLFIYLILNFTNSNWHPYSRIISIMISSSILIILTFFLLKEKFQSLVIKELIKRFNFGLKLIPHIFIGTLLITGDKYFIQFKFGEEDLGIYNFAFQLAAPILFIGTAVNQSFVTNLLGVKNNTDFLTKYASSLIIIPLSFFYQLFIYILFATDCFPKQYDPALHVFIILSFAALMQALYMNESSKLLRRTNPLKQSIVSSVVFTLVMLLIIVIEFNTVGTFSYVIILIWILMYALTKSINHYA